MSGKLIEEPPLIVLPSLARELGLVDAIVCQQLYYAGTRWPDGWVRRSYADWSRALRGVVAARSLERTFANLVKAGWAEQDVEPGKPTAFRITPRKLREGSAIERGEPSAVSGGSVSREEGERTPPSKSPSSKPILAPHEEHVGFSVWLAKHVDECGRYGISRSVPRAGTSYRSDLARAYGALREEGWSEEELQLASVGLLADEWMRSQGHSKPENVLRKTKLGGKVDAGRQELERRGSDQYGRFDEGDPRAS